MGDSGNPFAIRCNADLMRAIVYSGLGLTCFDSLVEYAVDELRYLTRSGMNQCLDASEVLDAHSMLQDQGYLVTCIGDLVATGNP